jgi:hypothetical protein
VTLFKLWLPNVIPTFVISASSHLSWWKEAAITDACYQQRLELWSEAVFIP